MGLPGTVGLVLLASTLLAASLAEGRTFLSPQYASEFLNRRRRANSFLEESKGGNLERECIEELCNKEEAREIFENVPETEFFYPKYLACLGAHKSGMPSKLSYLNYDGPVDLRSCVNALPDQCTPLPCNRKGYKECIDGKGNFTCICKPGWQGPLCDKDINECEDPVNRNAGCNQKCLNLPGSYRCGCEDGYYMLANKHTCNDRNECEMFPTICGSAVCKNTPGKYECECDNGYSYNTSLKACEDIDECADKSCSQVCVNSPGSYMCYCDGRRKYKLAQDQTSCESIPVCVPLNLETNYELLYLAEQFTGIPVVYLRFKLPDVSRFSAEFDFRTYDGEGVILYAESADSTSWFLLALRDGKIEIQFKNELWTKVTTGGKAINNGEWHIITVEELENIISVKIAKEAVMNINNPRSLFKPANGILETKVYIAGLPRKIENIIKPINPRLDGCIRGWNLMNQGALGVKEVIQGKQSKHCLVSVERGSYYPGGGVARFFMNYNDSTNGEWFANITLNIRSSTGIGVMFSLVNGETVPLAIAIEDLASDFLQGIVVSIHSVTVARLTTKRICTDKNLLISVSVTKSSLVLTANSYTDITYASQAELEKQLSVLDQAMRENPDTYLGGIPADIPVAATPVSAYYVGCMDVTINNQLMDLDGAISKQNDIRSHSCPLVL
ncbi:vitamin K-dependent protein S precursor [Xenopus tropicalis]|uniref:Vitamin K-dependent protein S n=1 Tax=Xenopus tropicalis TaxID=8364 RepID=B2GUS2_XENTR|nr:vitamin K-dependent protein S precursor [Xenopus tropicalis]AAI66387.1 LOC733989 protein [Xenopus tropicalis]|eukprot:NP_001119539.1 vitamin K-dependent protein S precursor [Xenopus tropicalis]